MTVWILAVLGLWVVQTFLPTTMFHLYAEKDDKQEFIHQHLRGRDRLPDYPVVAERAKRAQGNMLEALPVFLGLALLHEAHGNVPALAQTGAAVFFVGRLLYVPAYLTAIPMVRSLVWGGSLVGLAMMVWPLVG